MNYNSQKEPNLPIHRVLRLAADRVQALVDASLAPIALTMPHLLFLEHLTHARQGVPLGHVANALGCGRSNITQLADRLERLGLIIRQADQADRRSIQAVLTPRGRSQYPAGAAALRGVEEQLRRGLSPNGARLLVACLNDLTEAVPRD